ncbi:hypothetical protein SFRURICE_016618, partial [Spodoptera frugiperda]
ISTSTDYPELRLALHGWRGGWATGSRATCSGFDSRTKHSLCDPQIVVSGLGVMCMRNCMSVNALTTQEKNPSVGQASKMKRVKESGASYRNKRKAKLENIRANEGALLKYVKSVVPDTSDSSLGLNSSQTSGPSNPEQAEKIQELDTVPKDQIPTTSTALMSPSMQVLY